MVWEITGSLLVFVKDDGPRNYPTAPQPVPATFIVDQLLLERCDDGIMRLKGGQDKTFFFFQKLCTKTN